MYFEVYIRRKREIEGMPELKLRPSDPHKKNMKKKKVCVLVKGRRKRNACREY